jgi:hypothetical protein
MMAACGRIRVTPAVAPFRLPIKFLVMGRLTSSSRRNLATRNRRVLAPGRTVVLTDLATGNSGVHGWASVLTPEPGVMPS